MIAANAKHPSIELVADLAKNMKIDHQVLYNWEKRGIPAKEIDKLADLFDCNPRWLKKKEGEMHPGKPIKLITQDDLDLEEMGRLYRKMSPEDKVKFKGIAKIISNAATETKTQNGDD